jgi:hypothetical protein
VDILEALVNMADVLAELWPTDNTARILLRILVHYNFGAGVRNSEADRCRIVTEFCDTVLRDNAIRALVKDPPLSFRQAKERWCDVTERYAGSVSGGGARQDFRAAAGGGAVGSGQARGGFVGGGFGRGGAVGGGGGAGSGAVGGGNNGGGRAGFQNRNRNARVVIGGKSFPVCFDFNRASCNRKPSGCGCEDVKGNIFAHVCNYYNFSASKFCLARHTRLGNH